MARVSNLKNNGLLHPAKGTGSRQDGGGTLEWILLDKAYRLNFIEILTAKGCAKIG